MTHEIDWKNLERRSIAFGEHPKTCPDWGILREDGRGLVLNTLHQHYLYSGHLLGAMHHPRKQLDAVLDKARKLHAWCERAPVVLPPVLLEYALPNMPIRFAASEDDLGPVTLPRVASIALVESDDYARDRSCCFSSLIVVWFQDRFGDTPDDVKRQIAVLDWNALAFDWMP